MFARPTKELKVLSYEWIIQGVKKRKKKVILRTSLAKGVSRKIHK